MNIKVITRHAPSNYGSLLQSIATQSILEQLGCQCEIIDYKRMDERGLQAILTILKQKKGWNNNFIKKLIYIFLRYPDEKMQEMKFDMMRNRFLKMTERCKNSDELKSLKGDVFMTGSDQVWGPMMNGLYDGSYFLDFVDDSTRKIAYAASFGKTKFTESIVKNFKSMLLRYQLIAVRESSAVDMLKLWGIPTVGQVLDPTLLHNASFWSAYINREINKKYVLVYQLHNNPNLNEYAKAFSKKVGLPLLRISPSIHQIFRGGKLIFLPNLGKFLSYIKNATYMITDSFHGTAFAINFNTQFIEILPNNKTGSRNLSILQLTGLTNRVITDYNDFSIAGKNINYQEVNDILKKERANSIEILKSMITNTKKI